MTLLVIDTQALITNQSLYEFDLFVSNIKKLIDAARANHVEVIYIRHDDGPGCELTKGADGYEIYDEFQPRDHENIFDKTVNSAFKNTGLLEYLREKGETNLIITGIQTVDNEFMTGKSSYRYYNEFMWNGRYAE